MAKFRSNNTWEQQRFYNEAHEMMREMREQQRESHKTTADDVIGTILGVASCGVLFWGLFIGNIGIGPSFGFAFSVFLVPLVLSLIPWKKIIQANNRTDDKESSSSVSSRNASHAKVSDPEKDKTAGYTDDTF